MDDIEHELFKAGEGLGTMSRGLRIREAEIVVRDAELAKDLGRVIPQLDAIRDELRLLASRWHSTYTA
jgi:hypothetical protein